MSIDLADGLGLPVLSVEAMVARPVTAQQLAAAVGGTGGGELFEVVWSAATPAAEQADSDAEVVVFQSVPATDESDELGGVACTLPARVASMSSIWPGRSPANSTAAPARVASSAQSRRRQAPARSMFTDSGMAMRSVDTPESVIAAISASIAGNSPPRQLPDSSTSRWSSLRRWLRYIGGQCNPRRVRDE
jgi:hypothetical protein